MFALQDPDSDPTPRTKWLVQKYVKVFTLTDYTSLQKCMGLVSDSSLGQCECTVLYLETFNATFCHIHTERKRTRKCDGFLEYSMCYSCFSLSLSSLFSVSISGSLRTFLERVEDDRFDLGARRLHLLFISGHWVRGARLHRVPDVWNQRKSSFHGRK